MGPKEFNRKYSSFLEKGFPGLTVEDERFIDELDKFFYEIVKIKGFKYYKISEGNHLSLILKTNISRVLPIFGWIIENKIEEDLSRILEVEKEVKRRIKEIKEKNEESTRV
jgi:hypothetical protein